MGMQNAANWFEIPVTDLDRATRFYSTILEIEMRRVESPERTFSIFPFDAENTAVGGSLMHTTNFTPSRTGTIVYLNAGNDLDSILQRIPRAGGQLDFPKFRIEAGYLATFVDTEGNTVGLIQWDARANKPASKT